MHEVEKRTDVWLVFAGMLELPISRNALNVFTKASQDGIETIHFLIQSQGGDVNEGVFFYNLIREFPMNVITYNCGFVGSAAATAYLGAKKRVVSANGTFLLHKVTAGVGRVGNAVALKSIRDSVALDDARTENIIKSNLRLSEEQLSVYANSDLFLSAQDAIDCGLATDIGDFSPRGLILNI